MDNKQSQQTQTSKAWPIFILSILAGGSAITLTVLLYIWGYAGFIGSSSQSITGCSSVYFAIKFSNVALMNKTVFAGSGVAAVSGIVTILMSIQLLYRNCKDERQVSQCFKGMLYFWVCLMNLGSAVCVGYYLTVLLQVSSMCSLSGMSMTELMVILILAGVMLLEGLILWLIILCLKVGQSSQQKYKYVDTRQTEPQQYSKFKSNQREKNPPYYFTKPREEYKPRFYQKQQTKDNIYDVPSKSPFEKAYQRDRPNEQEKIYLEKRNYDSDPVDLKMRFVPRNRDQNIVLNLHPNLVNEKGHNLKTMMDEDDKYLREEQKRYMNDYNNRPPPLPRNSLQDSRDRKRYQPGRQQERYQGNNRHNRYGRPPRNNFYDDRRDNAERRPRDDPQDDYEHPPNRYLRDNDPLRRRQESPQRYNSRPSSQYDRD